MNQNTAASLKSAVTQVLSIEEGWETQDVRSWDVEQLLLRFQNKKAKEFAPDSLEAYKRRFRQALSSFNEYVENPGSWKYGSRPARTERNGKPRPERRKGDETTPETPATSAGAAGGELRSTGFADYPYPIREGQFAHLIVPADLTRQEAKKLYAFLNTVTVDFEVE